MAKTFTVRKGRSVETADLVDDPQNEGKKVLGERRTYIQGDTVTIADRKEADRLEKAGYIVPSNAEDARVAREAADEIPATFPGHDALENENVRSLSALRRMSDEELLGITGIGPKTLEQIRTALG